MKLYIYGLLAFMISAQAFAQADTTEISQGSTLTFNGGFILPANKKKIHIGNLNDNGNRYSCFFEAVNVSQSTREVKLYDAMYVLGVSDRKIRGNGAHVDEIRLSSSLYSQHVLSLTCVVDSLVNANPISFSSLKQQILDPNKIILTMRSPESF